MLTPESYVGELLTPILNINYYALAHALEVFGDISVGENSRNDLLKQVKEKRDSLLKDVIASKMKKGRVEKTLLQN